MSDKLIHSEIVRASDLKVGDMILHLRQGCYRFRIDEIKHHEDGSATAWEDRSQPGGTTEEIYGFFPREAEVARILPKPVEVRDFWRAECHTMTKEGDEKACREWIREMGYASTLEEITEIVKHREEVQP